jgi:DNA-binding winged helix-turn-helix (wHTH) protein
MREEQEDTEIVFGPFRLLPAAKQLWRNGARVELRPMSLAVLSYLARRPGQVVSGQELLKAVWAGTYVSGIVIRVCIREIRQALGDEVAHPHYIETLGQQGYRFIAPLVTTSPVLSSQFLVPGSNSQGQDQPLTTGNWSLLLLDVKRNWLGCTSGRRKHSKDSGEWSW